MSLLLRRGKLGDPTESLVHRLDSVNHSVEYSFATSSQFKNWVFGAQDARVVRTHSCKVWLVVLLAEFYQG